LMTKLVSVTLLAVFAFALELHAAARLTNSPPANGNLVIGWDSRGALEAAEQISGPWNALTNAPNPCTIPITNNTKFFRLNQTVDQHFNWMLDYGIDGVFVQRFVVGVAGHPTNVLDHARNAARRTGRTFALTYDMSGQATNTLYSQLTNDWRWRVDNAHITQDPRYLHHNGKPVLMIWGFFSDRFSTNLANQIIDFFKTDVTYGVTLVGGGEWWWRTETAPGWSNVFRRFDVYSPWNVGNYSVSGTNK